MAKQSIIFKRVIDILLCIGFLCMMGYHIFSKQLHEYLGIILLISVSIHVYMNRRWYRSLGKGKYSFSRIVLTIINITLSMLGVCCMFSGIMMNHYLPFSQHLFSISTMRMIHMVSSIWFYIFIGLHMGWHLFKVITSIKKRLPFFNIIGIIVVMYAGVILYKRSLWKYMFHLTSFAFLPYGESILSFLFDYGCLLIGLSFISYLIISYALRRS